MLRDEFNANFNTIDAAVASKTAADTAYYVDTAAGNDANDGLAAGAGHALKTIGAAISKLPQVINHNIVINIAAGTYAENVTIQGLVGKGSLSIIGGAAVGDNYVISSLSIIQCPLYIYIKGIRATSTTAHGFNIGTFCNVKLEYCKCIDDTTATTYCGVNVYGGAEVTVVNCLLSSKYCGIVAWSSRVYSINNTGTGNTYPLSANQAAIIGISGTQPTGTNANNISDGSMIDGSTPALALHLAETATSTQLGHVKIGTGVNVAGDGTISVTPTPLSSTTPTAETVGATGSAGTGSNAAREDHRHAMPATYTPSAHKSTHATGGGDALVPGDIGAANFTSGSYVGNAGATTRTISLGFTPKLVTIWSLMASDVGIGITTDSAGQCLHYSSSGTEVVDSSTNKGIQLVSNGFALVTSGSNGIWNAGGRTYYYNAV